MFNRKWYVVQKPNYGEIPNEIKIKRTKDGTTVQFICDQTYCAIPNTRIQPFGATEIDQKRGKRDAIGYKIATTAKYCIDADKNDAQEENGKKHSEKELPEILEGTTVTFKIL